MDGPIQTKTQESTSMKMKITAHVIPFWRRLSGILLHPTLAPAVALAAGGCLVGPDFSPPATDTPPAFIRPNAAPGTQPAKVAVPAPVDVVQWWRTFNDPELTSLVERSTQRNLDLSLASARLRQARAAAGIVGATELPDINAGAAYTRSGAGHGGRASPPAFGPGHHNTAFRSNNYTAGFDASWELDVFGGIRRDIESADASIDAAVEDRRDVLVTLLSEVAVDYIQLRGFQHQILIAQENLATQRHTLKITQQKFDAGFVSRLDVANASADVDATLTQIPSLESQAQQDIYAISVLLGEEPGALVAELSGGKPTPLTPPEVPIGLPADLLARRPDIRRSLAQLHAATAQVGVATADLYPKFTLVGSLNLSASRAGGLGSWANNLWSVGPSMTWPVFAGGRIVANIQVQEAIRDQSLITYDQTVLTALNDVDSALVAYAREQQRRDALSDEVNDFRQSVDLSNRLYDQGQTDFINVLTAERSLLGAQTALAQSDVLISTDLVALYKALGGGWQAEPGAANDRGGPSH